LTVNIVDRYLSLKRLSREQFQLLGITAMFIAGKFQEMYPPLGKDYIAISRHIYRIESLFQFEAKVLHELQFDLNATPVSTFMENYAAAIKLMHPTVHIVASFCVDLALRQPFFIEHKPSMIAAVALWMALDLEVKHVDPFIYEHNVKSLKNVMLVEEMDPAKFHECQLQMQEHLLCEMRKPSKSLLIKYGNTEARIYQYEVVARQAMQ
jgi:hypothetical protein